MRNEVVASLLVVTILAGAGAGYILGAANQRTVTSSTTVQSPYSECGFVTSCSTTNPSGIVLSMEMNTTSIRPNGSISVTINEFNPTQRYINMSVSDNWFLMDLPSFWVCYAGSPPNGLDIFRGYYTLQNVSIARNIINLSEWAVVPFCIYEGTATGFTFKPESTYVAVGITLPNGQVTPLQFYATSGRTSDGGYTLWSSRPAVYTIAVGDEWGDLVLAHFSVVATGQQG
jgi:hypothetical protein